MSDNDVASPSWVMLVEDDDELRDRILVPGLRDEGYEVEAVGSAREMYRAMLARDFAFFVIDVGLPDEDGFSLAAHLATVSDAPRVLLTGRAAAADRVRGLDGGADAYLTKPVDVEVLAATLRSLARRTGRSVVAPAGGWKIELEGWRLCSPSGKSMMLTQAEHKLLTALAGDRGQVVSRKAIAACMAEDPADFDPHRLDMVVHRLRRRAAAALGETLPIRAVRAVGYVLEV